MNKKDKKMLFQIAAIIIALILGCIFYKQRVEIITILFAIIGLANGLSGMIFGAVLGLIASFNAIVLGIVSIIVIYLIIDKYKPVDKVKKLAYGSMILALIIGFGGVMYQNHAEHQEQVAKYLQTHPTVISQKNVKQRVETQFDDDNVDAKVEVTGYDYSTGGSVIVKLNDSVLSVDKSDIDQTIASVCKALSKMNYKKYDGVNIKVEAENNDNYSTVGYAHVDKNNIPKINKSNVQNNVSDYQNKGGDFNS